MDGLNQDTSDKIKSLIDKGVYVEKQFDVKSLNLSSRIKSDKSLILNPEILIQIYNRAKSFVECNSALEVLDVITRVELEVAGALDDENIISIYKHHYKKWQHKFLNHEFATYLKFIEENDSDIWQSITSEEITQPDVIQYIDHQSLRGEGSFREFCNDWEELLTALNVSVKIRKKIISIGKDDVELEKVEDGIIKHLSTNQCVLLLSKLGLFEGKLEGISNTDKAKLVSQLIGKNEKNIKTAIESLEKPLSELGKNYPKDSDKVQAILDSLE